MSSHSPSPFDIEDQLQGVLAFDGRKLDALGRPERIIGRVVCADGFALSIQASSVHYCQPRDDYGPWHCVEVGFLSARVEALMPFADGEYEPTKNVYGYVPVKIVAEIIAEHGGIADQGIVA
jgi:hypothetical protein